jgi:ABC-type transport system involved in cytochrome c biogenesis permease subunit
MTDVQLAELSRTLFSPVTFLLLVAGMLAYLYAMAFIRVAADHRSVTGHRAQRLATWLTIAGTATLLAHMVTRSIASGRLPLGNMFEFSTVIALVVLVGGLVVVQWRLRRPEMMGFLLLGAVLTMGAALLVYTEPGPLMPILDSWWRAIHVSAIVFAAGVFTLGFVFAGLYLLRDRAERAMPQPRTPAMVGAGVGAGHAGDLSHDTAVLDGAVGALDGRAELDPLERPGEGDPGGERAAYRQQMRATINPAKLFAGTWLASATISWVFEDVTRFLAVNTVLAAAALLARWFVPYLPDAASLDALTYRTIAFGFPVWTFAVIAGAVWAEQSWGRYWGWDPKETSAFLTWVAYAAYLHARATRGMRGRKAGWLAILAFAVLMFTYYGVNLVVVGLHSYA